MSPRLMFFGVWAVLLGAMSLYRTVTGEPFLALFFASPNQPAVWRPLDPERYAGQGQVFLDGLAAYNRQDFTGALAIWAPLAEAGHPEAQYRVGNLYRLGRGVPKDFFQAARWYEKAMNQGSVEAKVRLANLYNRGQGVTENESRATELYRQAALSGNSDGMYGYGYQLYYGYGTKISPSRSQFWFMKSASLGHCKSHQMLSILYWQGLHEIVSDNKKSYYHAVVANKKGCPHDMISFFSSIFLDSWTRKKIENLVSEEMS